jgi:hypothetical protein
MALGFNILESIMTGYTTPKTSPKDTFGKNSSENNEKIHEFHLVQSIRIRVCQCNAFQIDKGNLGQNSKHL